MAGLQTYLMAELVRDYTSVAMKRITQAKRMRESSTEGLALMPTKTLLGTRRTTELWEQWHRAQVEGNRVGRPRATPFIMMHMNRPMLEGAPPFYKRAHETEEQAAKRFKENRGNAQKGENQ